jgi:hypothetical protein
MATTEIVSKAPRLTRAHGRMPVPVLAVIFRMLFYVTILDLAINITESIQDAATPIVLTSLVGEKWPLAELNMD